MTTRDEPDLRERARGFFAETGGDAPTVTAREAKQVKRSLLPLARSGDVEAQTLLGAIELEIEGKANDLVRNRMVGGVGPA